ncbi:MAG TPA: hypothetical protein VM617_07810, partial [Thermoanaerobaculia bacterium]|nr:hypothetical protein [Thermoanaerobaculia bacterium]
RSLLASPGHERIFSFCWYRDFCMAMVEERYKYVYHFGRKPLEVFDLHRDPGENRDLADDLPEEQITDALLRMAAMERSVERFWELRQPTAAAGAVDDRSRQPAASPAHPATAPNER